jgi:Protein of unknown function with HXXEE motif
VIRDDGGSFRQAAWLFPAAFAGHVAEEAPGFTAWAQRHASERYTQRDFVHNNALGFAVTTGMTIAVTRLERAPLDLAYYSLIVTQQALFNALFHAGSTVAFREYSPGLITSLLMVPLWVRLTRAALAERRLTGRQALACTVAAGALHAHVIARQVFFLGVPERP